LFGNPKKWKSDSLIPRNGQERLWFKKASFFNDDDDEIICWHMRLDDVPWDTVAQKEK
jgi:hypothetical protein